MKKYDADRNNPALSGERTSGLSPYLHFGHISPQRCAYEASKLRSTASAGVNAFVEELVVRRELSDVSVATCHCCWWWWW